MPKSNLDQHRQAIDDIDGKILALLNDRAEHACAIGTAKQQEGVQQLYDPSREASLLRHLMDQNKGPLHRKHVHAIYREVISACLALEQPQKVCYLGPEGTFTHMAALSHFGKSAEYSYRSSILDLFAALAKEECQYAVTPIENSTEGMVSQTVDLLASYNVLIIGELEMPIRHCLLANRMQDISAITEVHAHEQALSQCRHWLRENLPLAKWHKQPSNGIAVQKAQQTEHAAAVGSQVNADLYNMCILAENLQDIPDNKTRFVVLGKSQYAPSGKDKTALLFAVHHKPGSLYRVLGEFAKADIDLTRLESRPLKTASWSYSFFVECRGHITDPAMAKVVRAIEGECSFVKFLGSYPSLG